MKRTTFAYFCQQCGLDQEGTADYIGVDISIIRNWWNPKITLRRGTPKHHAWLMMAELHERIDQVSRDNFAVLSEKIASGREFELPKQMWLYAEADDANDPLPSGAKAAAGARCLAMLIEHFGEKFARDTFPVRF